MDYKFLSETRLFAGSSEEETRQMMKSLKHDIKKYKRGQCVYFNGQEVKDVGLVLSGSVQIENVDVLGNKSILGIVQAGDIFAESYACIPDQPILVDVITREDAEILFINIPSLFSGISTDQYSMMLIRNMLRIASRKNLDLSMRIFHSAPKTIRARLFSYFSEQCSLQGSENIRIPLNRQQLADYLGVDRTALSKELGKMRDEGLLTFKKNEFHIMIRRKGDIYGKQ